MPLLLWDQQRCKHPLHLLNITSLHEQHANCVNSAVSASPVHACAGEWYLVRHTMGKGNELLDEDVKKVLCACAQGIQGLCSVAGILGACAVSYDSSQ